MDRLTELQSKDPAALTLSERMELQRLKSGTAGPEAPDVSTLPEPRVYPTPTGAPIPDQSAPTPAAPAPGPAPVSAPTAQVSRKDNSSYDKLQDIAVTLKDRLDEVGDRSGDIQELKDSIHAAAELRDKAQTRNEWLEAAQTLATAVAQAGAAISGGTHANMSNLPIGQIDYGRRMDRASRDYGDNVGSARDIASLQSKERDEKLSGLKEGYVAESEPLKEKLRADREDARNATTLARYGQMEKAKDDTLDRRMAQQDKMESRKELVKDIQADQKQYQAAVQAANNSELMNDLSKKDVSKLQTQYGKILGDAGIDLDKVQATKPGTLWGTNPDSEKTKQNFKEVIADMKAKLDAKKAQLRSGAPSSPALSGTPPPPSDAAQSSTVRIQAPDGTIAEVPRDKAQKYIDKGGKLIR